MNDSFVPLTVVLATGGTGGHIFPAEALAETLIAAGHKAILVTDKRFEQYITKNGNPVLSSLPIYYISAASFGGSLGKKAIGMGKNTLAYFRAKRILARIQPNVVVGFGGYPSFPTMLAAAKRYPTVIHEQNSLLGKANRVLAGKVNVIATSFEDTGFIKAENKAAIKLAGNPVRSAIKALRGVPYPQLQPDGIMQLLVTGGSQGAAVFGDVLPKAVALLPQALRDRLRIDQQVRAEQLESLRAAYDAIGVKAELAPFFADIPSRLAAAHLVIARSGASTVAELTTAGRPAILVPLPSSADNHQKFNAQALDDAGGAWLMPQEAFTPEALAARLESFLNLPASLHKAADAARSLGRPDAAEALADIVCAAARRTQAKASATTSQPANRMMEVA